MNVDRPLAIQFCGLGGQGVILSAIVLGNAVVVSRGLNAMQTQSFGSDARGGECQAQIIVSASPLGSPVAEQVDVLVAMSQQGLERYLPCLRPGGLLLLMSGMVEVPAREDVTVLEVPALHLAQQHGAPIAANMAMVGVLVGATGVVAESELLDAVGNCVPPAFREMDAAVAREGVAWARRPQARAGG